MTWGLLLGLTIIQVSKERAYALPSVSNGIKSCEQFTYFLIKI